MDVLKEVAKDRLVIMVTHNETLAKKYSTRIVKLLDGVIVDDTDPYNEKESIKYDNRSFFKKASMSFITALQLSFSNLSTKKGRTLLVSFAGSIGIIGIALILSLSNGVNNYIAKIQEETLSSYPFTIEQATADITGAITSIMGNTKTSDSKEGVKEIQIAGELFSQVGTNDLPSFKKHLDKNPAIINKYTNSVEYYYGVDPQIYSYDTKDKVTVLNPSDMFSSFTNSINSSMVSTTFFTKMMSNRELLNEQYDVLAGSWPNKYNEVLLVLSDEHSMSDVMVYVLGLRDQEEFMDMMEEVMKGNAIENNNTPLEWSYEDLLKIKFKLVYSTDYYKYDSKYDIWTDYRDDEDYMNKLVSNGEDLIISGIVVPKEGSIASSLTPGIAYTDELIDHIIDKSSKTKIVKEQLDNKKVDVFSGKTFTSIKNGNKKTGLNFEDMISIDTKSLKKAFKSDIDENKLKSNIASSIKSMLEDVSTDITPATNDFNNAFKKLFIGLVKNNIDVTTYAVFDIDNYGKLVSDYMSSKESEGIINSLNKEYGIPSKTLSDTFSGLINNILLSSISNMGGSATLNEESATEVITQSLQIPQIQATSKTFGTIMTEAKMKINISTEASKMATSLISSMASGIKVDTNAFKNAFKFNLDEEELTRIISTLLTSGNKEYSADNNLRSLGYSKYEEPIRIAIYFKDFESKNSFKDFIEKYNENVDEEQVINYTDITGILMSSITDIVDIISYVLIAFVSVSLVVSSIMIGIITYISVLERTKEIGILRSIGASKRDISRVFNAETIIIGFAAGVFGIVITYLLDIVANIILLDLTKVHNLAQLPIIAALILIAISIFLTFIAGLIPSRIASKKDPVEALRTE